MGDFVASSSSLADGWRPVGMAPPSNSAGAREGRMTMDGNLDIIMTGEEDQGLSMSDHFLEEVSYEKIPFRFDFLRALVNIQRQEKRALFLSMVSWLKSSLPQRVSSSLGRSWIRSVVS